MIVPKKVEDFLDFQALEKLLMVCASRAIQQAKVVPTHSEKPEELMINRDLIDTLMKCYAESDYAVVDEELYIKNVRDNFIEYIEQKLKSRCLTQVHFNLMIPVIFYSLVVQNESHYDTVRRRIPKVKVNGGTFVGWKKQNPYAKIQLRKRQTESEDIIKESVNLSRTELNDLVMRKGFDQNILIADNAKRVTNTLLDSSEKLEMAINYGEYARAGRFLFDILRATHTKETSIDTMLRIYMVAQLHDVFAWSRSMIAGKISIDIWEKSKNPLSYCEREGANICPTYCDSEANVQKKAKELLGAKTKKLERFKKIYKYLSENFCIDIEWLLQFLLNKTELKWYASVDQLLLDYLKLIAAVCIALPNSSISEEYIGLEKIASMIYQFDCLDEDPEDIEMMEDVAEVISNRTEKK